MILIVLCLPLLFVLLVKTVRPLNLTPVISLFTAPPPGDAQEWSFTKDTSLVSKFSASEFPSVTFEDPNGNLSFVSAYLPCCTHSLEEYAFSCSRLHETCALLKNNKLYIGIDANVQMTENMSTAVGTNVSGT